MPAGLNWKANAKAAASAPQKVNVFGAADAKSMIVPQRKTYHIAVNAKASPAPRWKNGQQRRTQSA